MVFFFQVKVHQWITLTREHATRAVDMWQKGVMYFGGRRAGWAIGVVDVVGVKTFCWICGKFRSPEFLDCCVFYNQVEDSWSIFNMEAVGFRLKSTIAHQGTRVFKLYLIGQQNSPQAQFHVLLQDELVGLEQHVGQQLCGQSKLGLFGWVLVCDCFVWHHEEGSYYWRSIYWTARVYGISTTHWQSGRLARKMSLVLIWRFESYLGVLQVT